ncbi:MAG TPA: ribosomal protein S18-alanine N-acetyltransferase [Burkholderiales bacterium]|jgi:ribosomal-protein-alanine N-acetyltransferase|nr:ribosomal protein S18-alanine N-acetyltransferase [Burkholderiales bacterium]
MSALLDTLPRYRRMTASDLDAVIAIEESIYEHPWTPGNFSDSLSAGYHCWIVECGGDIAGYTVVTVAAKEAHLLNLSIAGPLQRRGLGRELLSFVLKLARDYAARAIVLEVRPSNVAALALYAAAGFAEIGVRKGYYPAGEGREDAVVLALSLEE